MRLRSVQLWRVHGREPHGAPLKQVAPGMLAVAGSVWHMRALVPTRRPAGVRSSSFVKRCLPGYSCLLQVHLDFLRMAGLLYAFFGHLGYRTRSDEFRSFRRYQFS